MRKTAILFVTLFSLLAYTSSYAGTKIRVGLVDRQQLQETVHNSWKDNKSDDNTFTTQQNTIKKLRLALTEQRKLADNDQLKDKEKSSIEAKIADLQKQLTDTSAELRKTMLSKRTERVQLMQDKIKTKVAAVARKHNVDLVLASHQVMYATEEVDITADVIKALKQP